MVLVDSDRLNEFLADVVLIVDEIDSLDGKGLFEDRTECDIFVELKGVIMVLVDDLETVEKTTVGDELGTKDVRT
jgi:hypothetical protein